MFSLAFIRWLKNTINIHLYDFTTVSGVMSSWPDSIFNLSNYRLHFMVLSSKPLNDSRSSRLFSEKKKKKTASDNAVTFPRRKAKPLCDHLSRYGCLQR